MAEEERAFDLEGAVNEAVEACNGDQPDAIRSLIIMKNSLVKELEHAWQQVSHGYP